MELFHGGVLRLVQEAQGGSLGVVPELPAIDAPATAAYIRAVLAGELPVPPSIACQVQHILQALRDIAPAN
jgi:hypothetical protein